MILFITTIDRKSQQRSFSCWLTKLETVFDFLSLISSEERLVLAELIDDDKCIQLPVSAFSGKPFSGSIMQLEREWKHILSEPVN